MALCELEGVRRGKRTVRGTVRRAERETVRNDALSPRRCQGVQGEWRTMTLPPAAQACPPHRRGARGSVPANGSPRGFQGKLRGLFRG